MEPDQFRRMQRERRTARWGGILTSVGGADYLAGTHWLDTGYDWATQAADYTGLLSEVPADLGLAGVGASLLAGAYGSMKHRTSERERIRRIIQAPTGWMNRQDLRDHFGMTAARKQAKRRRPSLSTAARYRQHEIGAPMGRLASGPRSMRGQRTVCPWEQSMLVVGEPGTGKSVFLTPIVRKLPGPSVIVSIKPEFHAYTARWRRRYRGPITVLDADNPEGYPEDTRFHWNLVRGCRDGLLAAQRAEALLESAGASGLSNEDFWTDLAQQLLLPLLAAADLANGTLRHVNRWLQSSDYETPRQILTKAVERGAAEPTMISTLDDAIGKGSSPSKATESAAKTAARVLRFMMSHELARTVCPEDGDPEFDFHQFVTTGAGTLYVMSGTDAVRAPIISAIGAEIRRVTDRASNGGQVALDPPVALVYDEAANSVPAIPVHEHSALSRSAGVWHCLAVQNIAQLREKWGHDPAATMQSTLPTTVILGLANHEDREAYSKQCGNRPVQKVSRNASTPATMLHRLFGNPTKAGSAETHSISSDVTPTFPADAFPQVLGQGLALVVPGNARPALVAYEHGGKTAGRYERVLDKVEAAENAWGQRQAEPTVAERYTQHEQEASQS